MDGDIGDMEGKGFLRNLAGGIILRGVWDPAGFAQDYDPVVRNNGG